MEVYRVGAVGVSDQLQSSNQPTYGVHSMTQAATTNFFDHEGASYFGELEEALMQGVVGIRSDEARKSFYAARPPTLEIFPSWPMRSQHSPRPAESSASGSAQNTISQQEDSPVSRKGSSAEQQQEGVMASEASGAEANHEPRNQEKWKVAGSTTQKDGRTLDTKTLRRLAQNREAARKSRLKKKAYLQQLECSKIRLQQLEHDLQKARSQGLFLGGSTADSSVSSGATIFDLEYNRWLNENLKHMSDLQGGLQAHLPDNGLRLIVDGCLLHYDEIFRLKGMAVKFDVFHLIAGMWKTPAERCFLWIGGFRPSELIKILMPHLEPLTEQQLLGICSLQQSSQQAEEALSQGLEHLHLSIAQTVASEPLGEDNDVGNYMVALEKFTNLEGFVQQADNLRQQTLHQMRRILTIRQAARCFLAIGEYNNRLRALSSLWASRPRANLLNDGHPSYYH